MFHRTRLAYDMTEFQSTQITRMYKIYSIALRHAFCIARSRSPHTCVCTSQNRLIEFQSKQILWKQKNPIYLILAKLVLPFPSLTISAYRPQTDWLKFNQHKFWSLYLSLHTLLFASQSQIQAWLSTKTNFVNYLTK